MTGLEAVRVANAHGPLSVIDSLAEERHLVAFTNSHFYNHT
jgi:hypothetical protein